MGNFLSKCNFIFSNGVHWKCMCAKLVWNWPNTMNIVSAQLILMAWWFSTRPSVSAELINHPCNSISGRDIDAETKWASFCKLCLHFVFSGIPLVLYLFIFDLNMFPMVQLTCWGRYKMAAIFLENISFKFVPKDPINNIPALVQIMAWHEPGNKPLSKPMMTTLLTHICLTLSQWVNKMTSLFQKMPCCWTCKQAFIWTNVALFSSILYESCSLCEFTHCGCQQGWNLQSAHWFLGNPDTM